MTVPRRRLVGLSTKMYFSLSKTRSFTDAFITELQGLDASLLSSTDIFIIPDFIAITSTIHQLTSAPVPIWVGAQDTHWEDAGAFTGEVSPAVLREAGVKIVEVGHAERRRIFAEDDEMTAKKSAAASRNGMIPLVCVGERTRDSVAAAVDDCRGQIEPVLAAVDDGAEVVLAYEPVWAIGATEPAGHEHVLGVVDGIRSLACVARRNGVTRVVYGGSAGPGLFERLKDGVDGLFLGRFGHDPKQFVKTIREVAEA